MTPLGTNMNTHTDTMADPRLPQGVVCLEQAVKQVDNSTVQQTLELRMENGWFLSGVNDHATLDTEYEFTKYTDPDPSSVDMEALCE